MVERGLHQAALPQPEVALAEDEAIAEEALPALCKPGFGVILVVRHQNLLDVVRVAQHIDTRRAQADLHNIAVLL